jgi:hypothetical protein
MAQKIMAQMENRANGTQFRDTQEWVSKPWVEEIWRDLETQYDVAVPARYRERVYGWCTGDPGPESFRGDAELFISDHLALLRSTPQVEAEDGLPDERPGGRAYHKCRLRAAHLLFFVAERTLAPSISDMLQGKWRRRVRYTRRKPSEQGKSETEWQKMNGQWNKENPGREIKWRTLKSEYYRARKSKPLRDACLTMLNEKYIKPVLAYILTLAHYYRERGEDTAVRELASLLKKGPDAFASYIELIQEHYQEPVGDQLGRAGLVRIWETPETLKQFKQHKRRKPKDSLAATIRAAKACLGDFELVMGARGSRLRDDPITAEVRAGVEDYIRGLESKATARRSRARNHATAQPGRHPPARTRVSSRR